MVAANDDDSAMITELSSASINRSLENALRYHSRLGPSNGGTGRTPCWNENSTRMITGR